MIAVAAFAVPVAVLALAVLLGGPRPTADVRLAARPVRPLWNAAAISGEYVSAAAFLGTAGLVLAHGPDLLWLPAGATAGYVLLLTFVAGPLRRSGAFTLADFAEWRFGSPAVRRLVSACVCCVGWFYLLPQFQGAGLTLRVLTGAPEWTGWALVAATSLGLALTRTVRGATSVQAVQFWVKFGAVALPVAAFAALGPRLAADGRPAAPRFEHATSVHVRTGARVLVPADVRVVATGTVDGVRRRDGRIVLRAGAHTVADGTRLDFPAGAPVPRPAGRARCAPHPLYTAYSALLGVLLGTVGLPHILMRFYTDAGGRAARRTAALVPGLLALFSLFPALYGVLGRVYTPELLLSGDTDAVILTLPARVAPGAAGAVLTGCVAAGAFAAFLSTSCGLVAAVAGTARAARRTLVFRGGAVAALAVPLAVTARGAPHGTASLVTVALTVSACSLCPLLVLGIWWRGLTSAGACAGLAVGGGSAVAAGTVALAGVPLPGPLGAVVEQPALVLVPLAAGVMVVVSLLDRRAVPARADHALARLHLPDDIVVR
ncbi:Cation/acetate symporter ActP [Actinomadura rubteroloni]|uniref:Cation/acetate symporter ActP n=1 Tax=Actinomadura rubteroloni TaxID=1926885 RepID=A0A2P4UGI3_9ACTN|nr:cation acetate symporter [Actinomadura rubteroloni]POM24116.1 Cation/acetate symporter ActP [Actinomadura rubteroloni]